MATYSFKKEDLQDNKAPTFKNIKGARQQKKELEEQRKNNKLMSEEEIRKRAKDQHQSYELPNNGNKTKGINHGERRGEKGGRYNQRTSKDGNSYRQYY